MQDSERKASQERNVLLDLLRYYQGEKHRAVQARDDLAKVERELDQSIDLRDASGEEVYINDDDQEMIDLQAARDEMAFLKEQIQWFNGEIIKAKQELKEWDEAQSPPEP